MTFPDRLRELREKIGLSEATLAETIELSFATVHNYGLGRRPPSDAVVKIVAPLGCDCRAFEDDVEGAPHARVKRGGKR